MPQLDLFGNVAAGAAASSSGITSAFGAQAGMAVSQGLPIIGSLISPFERATQYMANYNTPVLVPNEFVLATLLFRGELTESHWFDLMKMLGYDGITATRFLQAMKQLPSKTDQVRYVVKEAYTPEILGNLLGKEGLEPPAEFIKQMTRLGFSEADARREWIAHYDPLGRTEFEEMFQRLNPDQLKYKSEDLAKLGLNADDIAVNFELLKKFYKIKDIYSGIRERMALISYKPLARVDIRRLEDFDLIEPEMLEFYNREIGYSPRDAKLLTQFTILSNVLSDLKPLLLDGSINLQDGERILLENGASPQQAKKLIARLERFASAKKAKADRDLAITDYLEAYAIEYYDRATTKAELIKLGLDEKEAELKIAIREHRMKIAVARETGTRPKNLTKADIISKYRYNLISRANAEKELIAIGYDKTEAKDLLDIQDKKPRRS